MSEYGDAIDDLMTEDDSVFSQSATAQAVAGIDAEPDSAARAIQLARATRAPAPVINADLEGFEKRQKANLVGDMVRNSPALQKYVNGYPLANQVSNDDYPALHNLQATVAKTYLTAMDRGWKGVKEGWGDAPPVAQVSDEDVINHPMLSFLYMTVANPFSLAGRAAGAAVHGLSEVAGSYAESLAGEHVGKAVTKEVGGMLEWAMMRGDLGTIKQQVHPDAVREARKIIDAAAPYLQAGEMPPPGVHPMIDQLHAEVAKEDSKLMKDAIKAAQDSKTRERSPEAAEHFFKTTTQDRDIGISADAVRELYGEKAPLPDDGKLGWIPDLENQLRMAEQTGSDIQVPLSKFLANINPALAKELEPHMRLRAGGMTLTEAEMVEKAKAADPTMRPEPVGVEDYARREASLEPLAQVGRRDVRLQKASSEVDKYGQTFDTFHITDEGKPIGSIVINETPKGVLYVENWEVAQGSNTIGPHAVRALLNELKREYPNATSMGGYRVSGARTGTKAEANWAQVPLDKGPEALAQFLTDIKDWTHIEGLGPLEGTVKAQMGSAEVEFRPGELLQAKEMETAQAVKDIVGQLAPGLDVFNVDKINIRGAGMEKVDSVSGLYAGKWKNAEPYIMVALQGPNPVRTALHEVIHHLRSGFFTTKEWEHLENTAREKGWAEKHGIDRRYPEAAEWLRLEESIAEEYAAWTKENLLRTPRDTETVAIFKKLKEFFEQIKQKLEELFGKGITVDKLFTQVSAGEVGSRQPSAVGGSRFRAADYLAQAKEVEEAKMFERGAAIGMTQAQFKKYLSLMDEQRAETEARAKRRAERAVEVTKTEEWKQNESSVRAEVTDAVNTRPDVVADEFFHKGMIGDQRVKRQKMDPKYLTEEQRAVLGPDLLAEGGINPDSVAGLFGFVSGDRMVTALAAMKTARDELKMTPQAYKNQMVKDQFQATMMKRYGLPEHDALLKEAREDIVTETAMDMLAEETLALATKAGEAPPMSKADMKSWVKDEFRSQPAKQGKDMVGYLHDAGRAGRLAEDALLKGDAFEAFRQKQRQYISMLASQEAKAFVKEAAQLEKFIGRFSSRQVKGVPQEFTDQIHRILMQIDRPAKRSIQDLEKSLDNTSLEKFIASKEQNYGVPEVAPRIPVADFLLDPNFHKSLADMTVEEFRAVKDSLTTLAHNGRLEETVYKAGEAADLEIVKKDMLEQFETFPKVKERVIERGELHPWKVVRTYVSRLIGMETMFNRLSRNDPRGVFNEYIMRDLTDSATNESKTVKKYAAQIRSLADKTDLDKVLENPFIIHQTTGEPMRFTREKFREMLAYVGNPDGFKKLTGGYKIGSVEAFQTWIKQTATKEDWLYAQGVGKIFKGIKEEVDRLDVRQTGLATEDRPVWKVDTGHPELGEIDGWYNPIIYDPLQPGDSKKLMGQVNNDQSFRATTPRGYQKALTGYIAPVSFDANIVRARMAQMIHDLSFRESVQNAGKFFYDKDFQRAFIKHAAFGPEAVGNLSEYLKEVASGARFDSKAQATLGRVSEFFRQNAMTVYIGYGLGTVLKHTPTAAMNSMFRVGPTNFLRAVQNLASERPGEKVSNWQWAMNTFEELQRRHQHWTENLGGAYEHALNKRGSYGDLREMARYYGSYPVAFGDLLSAVPTAIAEYNRIAYEAGQKGIEFNHGDAVSAGNRAVRLAHGSTAITNRALIIKDMSPWLTTLYGFFSNQFQRATDLVWHASDTLNMARDQGIGKAMKETPSLAGELFAIVLWPALIEELVSPMVTDDNESLGMHGVKGLVHGVSSMVPIARDLASAVFNRGDPSMGLLGSAIKPGMSLYRDLISMSTHGTDRSAKIIRHSLTTFGLATGLAPDQISKIAELTYRSVKGDPGGRAPKGIGSPLGTTPDTLMYGVRHGTTRKARR